jgi:ribose transport system substrate-binding protein
MKRLLTVTFVMAALAATMVSGTVSAQEKKTLAFVTNVAADFWTIARRGTEKAASELPNYNVEFYVPAEATPAEQRRILDDLMTRGVVGISVSPINPANATETLNRIASQAVLFTTDSDAPQSKRAGYIGTDNVAAGRQVGDLIKKTLPDGGKIMLFVGNLDNNNARERVDGIKQGLTGTKVEIVDIRTDEADIVKAKRNVEDTLTQYPNISALVGLYAYNTPQIVEAVRAAGKEGKVAVIGFDEDPLTLRGITDGIVTATVVQQPYEFGYQSIKMLARYIEGDRSFIPENKLIIVPTRVIDKSNVADFQKELRGLLRK